MPRIGKAIGLKERDICASFYASVMHLQAHNYFKKDFILFHIPNEQYTTLGYTMLLKKMGLLKGAPDYCCVHEGGVFFMEFKRNEKCKLTKHQELFKERCEKLSIPYIIIYHQDDGIDFLKNYFDGIYV